MLYILKNTLRLEKISQRELSRLTGFREETISRVICERMRPSEELKRRVSEVLGMKSSDIFPERAM